MVDKDDYPKITKNFFNQAKRRNGLREDATLTCLNLTNTAIRKDHPIVCFLGDMDELLAHLSLIQIETMDKQSPVSRWIRNVKKIMEMTNSRKRNLNSKELETYIETNKKLADGFYSPLSVIANKINIARTVCRRAERSYCVFLSHRHRTVEQDNILDYLNKLSYCLFLYMIKMDNISKSSSKKSK